MSTIHFHQNERGTIDSTPCAIEECPRLVPAGQDAAQLLGECLIALGNLAPNWVRKAVAPGKPICFGLFPNADDCPCTACKVRRYLREQSKED